MKKLIGMTVIGLMLGMGAATAQDSDMSNMDMTYYDSNADTMVDMNEFNTRYMNTGTFARFDTDASGDVSRAEFDRGIYGSLDTNADGVLTEDELTAGANWLGSDMGNMAFSDYDTDASGDVSADEFNSFFSQSTLYSTFDSDTSDTVTEEEFNTGIFNIADTNQDQSLSADEFSPNENLFNSASMSEGMGDNSTMDDSSDSTDDSSMDDSSDDSEDGTDESDSSDSDG